ncbi:hypothetical protein KM914_19925 [Virgibacillus pantothenticus]|uniref:hypothetical protein n=1 Tax=Virgibacillus pantothenticus TaxID=1473 RepID=UPI001C215F44|nr:hypothetical protein [Virgibacillus pantothenticus]MBU8568645.1 hypothetical protein [Virgibacillus pantothenticus]MBU8602686.1 hypothetical protein [Virgibacillus pantothenticus]MBU8636776.1 hypothetical protein [Virgibacillus pantothenticus]MBU8666499.1 hypothetical protein [Virgibacillus pantothenticus]MEB5453851.1 hypothetical protein [Virgibacillus pantothenticus]
MIRSLLRWRYFKINYFLKVLKKSELAKVNLPVWIIQLTNPVNTKSIQEGIVHPDLPDTMIYFYQG